MMEWVMANWEWIMLGFYTLEKIVKLSPSKKDDIIFDAVIKPVWDKLRETKKSLESKKKELDKIKKQRESFGVYDKNTSAKDAADYLKKFSKERK
jgi:hypothetical protein